LLKVRRAFYYKNLPGDGPLAGFMHLFPQKAEFLQSFAEYKKRRYITKKLIFIIFFPNSCHTVVTAM
jgi:aspartate carbamoyltransferase catalytic subunit